jgi:hypothetical protein
MRHLLIGLLMTVGVATSAQADVRVNIGINIPTYPRLVQVPGYPVYYAPTVDTNYFFYDGLYWVFNGDQWLASSWYNGPWHVVGPDAVPVYVLQVPVRYYRRPPAYFHGWRHDAAPRWGDHWGHEWSQRHTGWDSRRGRSAAAAPLPSYQRNYSGDRYPRSEQQVQIHSNNYRYQPRDKEVREQYQQQGYSRQDDDRGQGHGKEKHDDRGGEGHGKGPNR